MKKKKQTPNWVEQIGHIEAFLDGLDDEDDSTPEARKALFEKRGWSVQRTLDAVHDHLAGRRAKQRLEAARAEREKLLEQVRGRTPTADPSLLDRIMTSLQSLVGRQPELAGVYFRRFEQAGPEDLQTLLEDLQALEEIDAEPQ